MYSDELDEDRIFSRVKIHYNTDDHEISYSPPFYFLEETKLKNNQ